MTRGVVPADELLRVSALAPQISVSIKFFWRSRLMSFGLRGLIISVVVAGSFGCLQDVAKDVPKEVSISEIKGACADVHKSQVCTWAKMQGETVLEVGATVPIGA